LQAVTFGLFCLKDDSRTLPLPADLPARRIDSAHRRRPPGIIVLGLDIERGACPFGYLVAALLGRLLGPGVSVAKAGFQHDGDAGTATARIGSSRVAAKDIFRAISRRSPDGAIYDLGKLFFELVGPPLAEVRIY
jgi:hypothetical protein